MLKISIEAANLEGAQMAMEIARSNLVIPYTRFLSILCVDYDLDRNARLNDRRIVIIFISEKCPFDFSFEWQPQNVYRCVGYWQHTDDFGTRCVGSPDIPFKYVYETGCRNIHFGCGGCFLVFFWIF